MKRALIGYTGFVGASLLASGGFTHGFNRADAAEARGIRFGEVVVAAVPCLAAQPDDAADAAAVAALAEVIASLQAERCVLLSSPEVFAPGAHDEDAIPAPSTPAGVRRRALEELVAGKFARSSIVRLPGLFGDGLKANALFELASGRAGAIDPAARRQWYPLRRLAGDLEHIAGAGLAVAHLAPEPVAFREVLARHFRTLVPGREGAAPAVPELTTRHAALFGALESGDAAPYLMRGPQVLAAMGDFLTQRRRRGGAGVS